MPFAWCDLQTASTLGAWVWHQVWSVPMNTCNPISPNSSGWPLSRRWVSWATSSGGMSGMVGWWSRYCGLRDLLGWLCAIGMAGVWVARRSNSPGSEPVIGVKTWPFGQ